MIHLVSGGCRSGKTAYGMSLLQGENKIYIATAYISDDEMTRRVLAHQAQRGKGWHTIECPVDVPTAITKLTQEDWAILDSASMWVANIMGEKGPSDWMPNFDTLLASLEHCKANLVIITDEVGLGIVPISKAGRRFRDLVGRLNQEIATRADKVTFMVCGLPMKIK